MFSTSLYFNDITQSYVCSNCGRIVDHLNEKCPGCGFDFTGVYCERCGYTNDITLFITNRHYCGRCRERVRFSGKAHFANIKNPLFNFREAEKKEEEREKAETIASLVIVGVIILALAIVYGASRLLGIDFLTQFQQWWIRVMETVK